MLTAADAKLTFIESRYRPLQRNDSAVDFDIEPSRRRDPPLMQKIRNAALEIQRGAVGSGSGGRVVA